MTARHSTVPTAIIAGALGMALLFASQQIHTHLNEGGMLSVEAILPIEQGPGLGMGALGPRRVRLRIPNSSAALAATYRSLGYRLADVVAGSEVPRIYLRTMPRDFDASLAPERRKSLFLHTLLPLVLKENERLRGLRARIVRNVVGGGLEPAEAAWLAALYEHYAVEPGELATLLRRVDPVPPSLALAQAATESAWGTSRFAREGNALFGMWTWSPSVPGIVPRERPDDARHRIRSFESLEASVQVYMFTLNTHWAYRDFRDQRESLRRVGRRPRGLVLAGGMGHYSVLREAYTVKLREVIRGNRLHALDHTVLAEDWGDASIARAGTAPLTGAMLVAQEPGR